MRFLYLFLFLHMVSARIEFKYSYRVTESTASKICRNWSCLYEKFNFKDEFPPKEDYLQFFQGLLPPGDWQTIVHTAIDHCYENKTIRQYINWCPGQNMMHCVVDNLIRDCPNKSNGNFCTQVTSVDGTNYMFSQGRYDNMEEYLQRERRPSFFLRNFFRINCCDLPQIFNQSLLNECGFDSFMQYRYHEPQINWFNNTPPIQYTTPTNLDGSTIGHIYNFHTFSESTTAKLSTERSLNTDYNELYNSEPLDPLDCCEMDDFIKTNWRSECDFKLKWDASDRLIVRNDNEIVTTTEKQSLKSSNVKIEPNSCKELTPSTSCVANKMGILNQYGFVNYFRITHKIRMYSDGLTSSLYNLYVGALLSTPYYPNQCISPRRLLNVIDSMLTTCDISRRKTNQQCNKFFSQLNDSIPSTGRKKLNEIMSVFNNRYFPISTLPPTTTPVSRIVSNRLFDFGLLGSKNEPPVVTIDLKPKEKPLVLLPVYQRLPKNDSLAINSLHNDGVWRG